MTDIAIQQFIYDLAAGQVQLFTVEGDFVKCRAQTASPTADATGQVPLKVSLNNTPQSQFIVGINYKPNVRIETIRLNNPNPFAVRVQFTVGRGDITDDLVILDAGSGFLPVELAEGSQVRVDANFHDSHPIKTTNSEIQRFEQRNPNQVIDRASGRVIMPPRARSLRNAALMTGGLRERGAYNWHNGIRGDQVAVRYTTSNAASGSFYTPEFVGQARVFGLNPSRKKLTIKSVQHGLLVSRVPFVLPRAQSQEVFSGGQLRFDNFDEYVDAVLCVLGGFVPAEIQIFNPFSNTLTGFLAARGNNVLNSFASAGREAWECDIANSGGLVNGAVPSGTFTLNGGVSGYQGWGLSDDASDTEAGDEDNLYLFPDAVNNKGIYVNAGGTMWLQEGDEMVIEDHAPVYCLGCDQTLPTSTALVNTLYNELSQFTWTEEFYAAVSLTG